MTTLAANGSLEATPSAGPAWRQAAFRMVVCAIGLAAFFASDVRDMATIWFTASTYNHCALIPFLSGWLAWQRRDEIAHIAPGESRLGLVVLAAGALLWLIGDAGGIAFARQAGFVVMLQSLVPLFLGLTLSRALLFPVAYLLFMVPVGEELLPILQTLTARMSMALLDLAGIPAHLDGIFITTPNGYYKVAEACAGVKFLVAMLAYGALVANVCFRSWGRRAGFMAACVIVPILANGVRAFATMYVGYLTTADTASGFDHVLYGWFFFAFVMAAVMAMAWPFFDRKLTDPWVGQPLSAHIAGTQTVGLVVAAAMVALAPLAWSHASTSIGHAPMPSPISLPDVPGWRKAAENGQPDWSPVYRGADHMVIGHYVNEQGQSVDLALVLFAWQEEGREIVGYGQGAAGLDARGWVWSSAGPMMASAKTEYLTAPGPVRRLATTWFVMGGEMTGSAVRLKFRTMVARLFGRDQAVAAVIVSAQDRDGMSAEATVRAFARDIGAPTTIAQRAIAEARR